MLVGGLRVLADGQAHPYHPWRVDAAQHLPGGEPGLGGAITCSTLAELPGWRTVSTMRISGIFMGRGGGTGAVKTPL